VAKILEEVFVNYQKDEKLYNILQIKHYKKMMPQLVMPNFQLATMAFPTKSTSTTQASEI
jgi:hypothetical protein